MCSTRRLRVRVTAVRDYIDKEIVYVLAVGDRLSCPAGSNILSAVSENTWALTAILLFVISQRLLRF